VPAEPEVELTEVKIKEEPMDTETILVDADKQENEGINTDSGVFSQEPDVKIKEEPVDEEEEAEAAEPPQTLPEVDTTKSEFKSSIDGNVEFEVAPSAAATAPLKIKINITTPAPALPEPSAKREEEEPETPSEYVEEPMKLLKPKEDDFELKPKLKGRRLQDMPPVMKGKEDSALCSIM